MFQKLKQYKNLRDESKKAQKILETEVVHADAAGGKIAVVMDGNQKITAINIDAELLHPENKQKIESGIKDAFSGATKKVQVMMMRKIKSGDLKMPDLSNFS